jgi:vacuolar-type H+-ATPase subunit I/STV1
MSTEPVEYRLPLANGAILKAPVFETHYRGSNWLAVIDIDAGAPGGLSRCFASRGKGACLYAVEQVSLFDAVEFAADYTTSTNRKRRLRWYGVVIAKTDDELVVREFPNGAEACLYAKKARVSPADRIRALNEERELLIRKAANLSEEIASLDEKKEDLGAEKNLDSEICR